MPSSSTTGDEICYDDVLASVGEFGRFQKLQFLLLNMVALVGAFHGFNMVFNGATPDHHCALDSSIQERCNINHSVLVNYAIPRTYNADAKRMELSQCSMRDVRNFTASCQFPDLSNDNGTELVPTMGCDDGWHYSNEYYTATIVTEWDLVCTQQWKRSMTDTMFFAGRLVGAVIFGHLADRFGRKPMLLVTTLLQATFGVVTAVMPSFVPFIIFYFFQGAVQCGTFILAFVYVTEIVCPSKRKVTAMANRYFYCLGQIALSGIAALLRDWRAIELAISLPGFFFIFYIWLVPESGRWLISKGRYDEAVEIVEKIADINGCSNTPVKALIKSSIVKVSNMRRPEVTEGSIKDLFSSWLLARISLVTWFLWFVNSCTYVAMGLQTRHLAGNPYINFLISALMEVPALTLALLLIDRIGRKICATGFMSIAALACSAAAIVPNGWLDTAFIMLAKFGISGSFAIVFLMSAELFPTSVRNMAMGVSAMCGHLGSTAAPLILATREVFAPLPMIVFGVLSLIAAIAVVSVPEMLGCPLPQTISDLLANVNRVRQKTAKLENAIESASEVSTVEIEIGTCITNPAYMYTGDSAIKGV